MPTLWHFTIFFKFKQIKIRIILINVHGAHQTFYHDHEGNVRELKSGIVYLFHLIYWQHGHKAVLWQTLFDKLVADIFLSFLLLMCQQAYTFLIPSLLYKFIKTVLSLGFTKLSPQLSLVDDFLNFTELPSWHAEDVCLILVD